MARLKVTHSQKAGGGRITGLYGPGFGFRPTEEVARHILDRTHQYYVREGSWAADLKVEVRDQEVVLKTTNDVLSPNNLQNLPDF